MNSKHWADEFNEIAEAKDQRIADLERQLAEKQAEIEAMRPVVEVGKNWLIDASYQGELVSALHNLHITQR